ncbi:MAG TPA: DNA integrity scanning diadenylate cyclase DisA [Bacillota bacterium]|jgi:diadenylate cyclase
MPEDEREPNQAQTTAATARTPSRQLLSSLRKLAPGTAFREGLESILRARTGALIVVGEAMAERGLLDGGFKLGIDLTPSHLYELSKMDGAIITNADASRILYANVQLLPDPAIPSGETGIRHRTAERTARQTGDLVVAISQRRNVITLYQGTVKYVLKDVSVILAKANQAVQTMEKYRGILEAVLTNLSALELEDLVTLADVVTVIQRSEMLLRIESEVEGYITELGTEGRLVGMQAQELAGDVASNYYLTIRDYCLPPEPGVAEHGRPELGALSSEDLLDPAIIGRIIGYPPAPGFLDRPVTPRGYRILSQIPRLPAGVIDNLVDAFGQLPRTVSASIEELDAVDGIGEVRAKAIKDGLRRLRDKVIIDRQM